MEPKTKKIKMGNTTGWSTFFYIVVIFFIGLPMWWKTTEIFRVSLPYSEILSLDATPILSSVEVGIFVKDENRRAKLVGELKSFYESSKVFQVDVVPIKVDPVLILNTKTPAQLEKSILKHYKVKLGNVLLVEWAKLKNEVIVTNDRTIFMSEDTDAAKIYETLSKTILYEEQLKSVLEINDDMRPSSVRNPEPVPSLNYNILISLLNPRPDLQKIHWNIEQSLDTYLKPFFNQLKNLSTFSLRSQRKYQVKLEYNLHSVKDNSSSGRHFTLKKENLPYFITSIERKLGTDISDNQCINFVVYVPPCVHNPLYVDDFSYDKTKNATDSFISAMWGGIIIANPPESVCAKYINEENVYDGIHDITVDSYHIMQAILYQTRRILNIGSPERSFQEDIFPATWESDFYLRRSTVQLIHTSTSTLQSLIKLLGDIKNIVINEDVGSAIFDSYENILKAKKSLLENNLEEAVEYAKIAYHSSEVAFFDPSILSLLYFPDEQKYAIYIPLYLPIMIPSLLTILDIVKHKFGKQKTD